MVQLQAFIASMLFACVAAASLGERKIKILADFTTSDPPAMETVNDTVMGGVSLGSVKIEDGGLVWEGELKLVEKLGNKPGFCTLKTKNFQGSFPQAKTSALCVQIDPTESNLLPGMSISIMAATNGSRWGTSYKAELKGVEQMKDSVYCAALNADTFTSGYHGWNNKEVAPFNAKFLEGGNRMSIGAGKDAGLFKVKLVKIFVAYSSDERVYE